MRRTWLLVLVSVFWLGCGGDDIGNPFANPIDASGGRGARANDGSSDRVGAGGGGVGGRAGSAGNAGVTGGGGTADVAPPDDDGTATGPGPGGAAGSSGAGGGGAGAGGGVIDVGGDATDADGGDESSRDGAADVSRDGGSAPDVVSDDRGPTGDEPGCNGPSQCPTPANECLHATCADGGCGTAPVAAGTAVANQVDGNCKKKVCDGNGGTQDQDDDSDVADDSNACTLDGCSGGTPTHVARTGEGCGNNGVCSAGGQCVGCLAPADCPGTDDFCKSRTCNAGTCGWSYMGIGIAFPSGQQRPGDCKTRTCDGHGGETAAVTPSDLPVDSNVCTKDLCTGATPSNPPEASGKSCGGGRICDGAGACVECLVPAQCGNPLGYPCVVATCSTDHHCGTTNAAPGTACGAGASCRNGSAHAVDTCSGGFCVAGADDDCSPYACGPSACKGACSDDGDCAGSYVCDTGLAICVPANTPKCTDYCSAIKSVCTGGNEQYGSDAACLHSCAPLQRGANGDVGGNTVGCRITHAGYAVSDPISHCPHAGPGGEVLCGDPCVSFCTIAAEVCTGSNEQFASMNECLAACAGFPAPDPYTVPVATGDTFACRLHELTLASLDPDEHCPNIPAASSVCQ